MATAYLKVPLTHNGTGLSGINISIYNTANASTGATADIASKATIQKDGDKVKVSLKEI